MKTIYVRTFSGEVVSIEYKESPPKISDIRKMLYDKYVGGHGRNEIVSLFKFNKEEDKEEEEKDNILKDDDDIEFCDGDELGMIISFEREMKKHENNLIEEGFKRYLEGNQDLFDVFKNCIIDSKALVAGGSLLACLHSYSINDIDIYVQYSNAIPLIEKIKTLGFSFYPCRFFNSASQYDGSFFRKNNIIARFMYERGSQSNKKIDILIIPDNVSVESIVTNFDLSFCETWWDGKSTFSSDPYGLRNKTGILKPAYRKSLFEKMNLFIVNRIIKYKNRGFTIDTGMSEYMSYSPEYNYNSEYSDSSKEEKKIGVIVPDNDYTIVTNKEHWAVSFFLKKIHEYFVTIFRRVPALHHLMFYIYFTLFPQRMTYEELKEKIGENCIAPLSCFIYNQHVRYTSDDYKSNFLELFKDAESFVTTRLEYESFLIETFRDVIIHLLSLMIKDYPQFERIRVQYNSFHNRTYHRYIQDFQER